MNKNLIIIGYSGHAYVAIDIAIEQGFSIIGYIDSSVKTSNPFNIEYLGNDDILVNSKFENANIFISIGDNTIRKSIFEKFKNNILFPTLQHRSTIKSAYASVGEATLLAAGCVINPLAFVGNACIINTLAIVEHECTIGDYSHIGPGAVLAGNVSVGESTFIGANSVVKQGIKIGNNVTIGAGTVVLKDVKDNDTLVGNPARNI
jgi:sugar O-acyltransferase (sialic acid O-acetyltransferase NeuD family)